MAARDVHLLRPVARSALRMMFMDLHAAALAGDGRAVAQVMRLIRARIELETAFAREGHVP